MVNHQDLIKYSMKVGTVIYNNGCEKLTTEFDMKSSGTIGYTTKLQATCVKMGWHMGTQQIINFTNGAGSTINIVHQYRQINTATLQAQCKVFFKSTGALFQARAKQNNTMMSECIMKTLTPAARVRLLPFQGDYNIDNLIYTPLLHKKIMSLATIDFVATTKTLRSNLRELPTYCSTIKGDIKLLHSYFNSNYTQIVAHGETVNNPVGIPFSVYNVIPCRNFRSCIKRKQDAYTDWTLTLTHDELIMLATNKFNLLKQEGTWAAKSPDKDKIIVMQAELTALKGRFQLVAPNLKKATVAKDDDKEGGKKHGGGDNKKNKNKKNNTNKKEQKIDEIRRRHLPRKEKLTRRRSRDVSGIGASTTWHKDTTRNQTANLAKTATTSRMAVLTKS
jgi:hypothetical protein